MSAVWYLVIAYAWAYGPAMIAVPQESESLCLQQAKNISKTEGFMAFCVKGVVK